MRLIFAKFGGIFEFFSIGVAKNSEFSALTGMNLPQNVLGTEKRCT